jgi:hypothetical protein
VANNFICNAGTQELTITRYDVPSYPSSRVNIIANAFERGEMWKIAVPRPPVTSTADIDDASVYIFGNYAFGSGVNDDWDLVGVVVYGSGGYVPLSMSKRRTTPWPDDATFPVTIDPAASVKNLVLSGAGATFPCRDELDERLVDQARDSVGKLGFGAFPAIPVRLPLIYYYPTLAGATPLDDTDSDGMPDDWEIARSLNPNDDADGILDDDSDGYTNLEEYLNEIVESSPNSCNP